MGDENNGGVPILKANWSQSGSSFRSCAPTGEDEISVREITDDTKKVKNSSYNDDAKSIDSERQKSLKRRKKHKDSDKRHDKKRDKRARSKKERPKKKRKGETPIDTDTDTHADHGKTSNYDSKANDPTRHQITHSTSNKPTSLRSFDTIIFAMHQHETILQGNMAEKQNNNTINHQWLQIQNISSETPTIESINSVSTTTNDTTFFVNFSSALAKVKQRSDETFGITSFASDAFKNDVSAEATLLKQQQYLNVQVRKNPFDVSSWKRLATLMVAHEPRDETVLISKRRQQRSLLAEQKSNIQRSLSILREALKQNPGNLELSLLYLSCTLKSHAHFSFSDDEFQTIRKNLQGEQETSSNPLQSPQDYFLEDSTFIASKIFQIYRMKLQCFARFYPVQFSIFSMRKMLHEALTSLSKVSTRSTSLTNCSSSQLGSFILLSDVLKVESQMGHSERVCGIIQAIIELNLRKKKELAITKNARLSDSINNDFKLFWDSENPRIGDIFPAKGWDAFRNDIGDTQHQQQQHTTETTHCNRRPTASSYFSNSEERYNLTTPAQSVSSALPVAVTDDKKLSVLRDVYTTCVSFDNKEIENAMENSATSALQEIIRLCNKVCYSSNHDPDETVVIDGEAMQQDEDEKNKQLDEVNKLFNGDLIPSTVPQKNSNIEVYSLQHQRRIEVSKQEMSSSLTRNALKKALEHLRHHHSSLKNSESKDSTTRIVHSSQAQVASSLIDEADPFLQLGKFELCNAAHTVAFIPPCRFVSESEQLFIRQDPFTVCLFEDGIGDLLLPFLSNFESHDMSTVILLCLSHLGILFPRSRVYQQCFSHGEYSSMNCFSEVFDGVFYGPSFTRTRMGHRDGWCSVLHYLTEDNQVVSIDMRILTPAHVKQREFVRKILYELVWIGDGHFEWEIYVQIALMKLECLILLQQQQNIEVSREILRKILSVSEVAKRDPRLWTGYLALDNMLLHSFGKQKQADSSECMKVALSACSAAEKISFSEEDNSGWCELCVQSIRHSVIGSKTDNSSSDILICQYLTAKTSDQALHLLCCLVEGDFVPFRKKQKHKDYDSKMSLVPRSQFLKCKAALVQRINSVFQNAGVRARKNDVFDVMLPVYFHIEMVAWFEVLNPSGSVSEGIPDFSRALIELNSWIEKSTAIEASSSHKYLLVKLLHLKLELGVWASAFKNKGRVNQMDVVETVLVPAAVSLKLANCSMPSPILLAMAECESRIPRSNLLSGYTDVILAKREINRSEALYLVAQAVLVANNEVTKDFESDCESSGSFGCTAWTKIGIGNVRSAILEAIGKITRDIPTAELWNMLIHLELFSGISLKSKRMQSFNLAAIHYERALVANPDSKRIWLMPFTILYPWFDKDKWALHLLALEETGVRLRAPSSFIEQLDI